MHAEPWHYQMSCLREQVTRLEARLKTERAAGLAEGLARAAEIARAKAAALQHSGDYRGRIAIGEIAEAILAASPPDLKEE